MKKVYFLLLFALCVSCKDDDNTPVPEVNNQITIEGITSGQTIDNTVLLSFDTEGNPEVEVAINSVVLGKITSAPYELSWNTRDFEDGKYTVSAKAVYESGATAEATVDVNVLNTLVEFTIGDNIYLQQDLYVVITDTEGAVLADAAVGKTSGFTVQVPEGFEGDRFDLHFFGTTTGDNGLVYVDVDGYSYLNQKKGLKWNLTLSDYAKDFDEEITVTCVNGNTETDSYYFRAYDFTAIVSGANINNPFYMNLTFKEEDILVEEKEAGISTYKLVENVTGGSSINVDLSDVNVSSETKNISVSPDISWDYDLRGIKNTADRVRQTPIQYSNVGKVSNFDVRYPADMFTEYSFSLRGQNEANGTEFSINTIGSIPSQAQVPTSDIQVVISDGVGFELTTSNDADVYLATFESYEISASQEVEITWYINAPLDRAKFSMAGVIDKLKSKYPDLSSNFDTFEYEGVSLIEGNNIADYDAYMEKVHQTLDYDPFVIDDYCLLCSENTDVVFVNVEDFTNAGGRTGSKGERKRSNLIK